MSDIMPTSLPDIKQQLIEEKAQKTREQSALDTIQSTATIDIKFRPSKHAAFMQAAKVHTPKYKFYVEVGGNPTHPTIVLIMGLGAQSLVWPNEFCYALITAGFRVVRFDNRDIGKSSKLKHKKLTPAHDSPIYKAKLLGRFGLGLPLKNLQTPYDLYDMAEDAYQLLKILGIKKYFVIGQSMGGMIAQIMAVRYPHQVEKLGLLSTSNNRPFSRPPAIEAIRAFTQPLPKSQDADALTQQFVQTIKTIASPDYFDEQAALSKAKKLFKRRFYPKGTQRQLLAILATGSLVDIDKQIHQPTLIIHGKQDKLIPFSHAYSLAKHIAHSQLILIDALGHDMPLALIEQLASQFIAHFSYNAPIN